MNPSGDATSVASPGPMRIEMPMMPLTVLPIFILRIAAGLAAAVIAAAILLIAVASPAAAHAALIGTEPADGAVIEAAPARFVLRFSEPVSPLVFRLVSPGGASAELRGAERDGNALVVPAPPDLVTGTHLLSWRVVSKDGHPVGGSVVFSVGAPSGRPHPGSKLDWPVLFVVWSTKVLLYLGLFVGVGGLAYGAAIRRLDGQALLVARAALVVGLLAVPLAVMAQGLDALGVPLSGALRLTVWRTSFATAFGRTTAIAALSFGLGLLAARLPNRRAANGVAGLALVCAGVALASSGHASDAPPQWATRPAVFLHAVAIAFWVGGLVPLGIALQDGGTAARTALKRFSAAIPWAVVPLAASGILLGVVQVQTPAAMWTTRYGWVLCAKLAMVAALFALAAWNRWSLTAKAAGGSRSADERLVASIALECCLALLILATAALWRFTPPPRALAEAAARPSVAHLMSGRTAADVTVAPGHAGLVAASAVLKPVDEGPADPKEVTFVFSKPDAGIEAIRTPGRRSGDGTWRTDAELPVPGRWTLRLDVLVDDFTLDRVEGEMTLRPN